MSLLNFFSVLFSFFILIILFIIVLDSKRFPFFFEWNKKICSFLGFEFGDLRVFFFPLIYVWLVLLYCFSSSENSASALSFALLMTFMAHYIFSSILGFEEKSSIYQDLKFLKVLTQPELEYLTQIRLSLFAGLLVCYFVNTFSFSDLLDSLCMLLYSICLIGISICTFLEIYYSIKTVPKNFFHKKKGPTGTRSFSFSSAGTKTLYYGTHAVKGVVSVGTTIFGYDLAHKFVFGADSVTYPKALIVKFATKSTYLAKNEFEIIAQQHPELNLKSAKEVTKALKFILTSPAKLGYILEQAELAGTNLFLLLQSIESVEDAIKAVQTQTITLSEIIRLIEESRNTEEILSNLGKVGIKISDMNSQLVALDEHKQKLAALHTELEARVPRFDD